MIKGGGHSRAFGVVLALIVAASTAACGSSANHPSAGARSPSPTASAPPSPTPSPTGSPSVDGTEINTLPTVPTPSAPPPVVPRPSGSPGPDLSTVAAQNAFLRSVFNDVQAMWNSEFSAAGVRYSPARLVLFQSQVQTGCGIGKAEFGPFYCSGDHSVYLDISFFAALYKQFGVGGDFAEAYVVAHEVGHHVQNLLGITHRVVAGGQADPSQANALSVRAELQADCFAGVWEHSAYTRNLLRPGDIEQALAAAQVVGDDFMAHASGSPLDVDSFTHGTSAQRQQWFTTGYEQGRPDGCDTFAPGAV